MVDITKFNTGLKFGVVDHFLNKRGSPTPKLRKERIDNNKFKTNLAIQAVSFISSINFSQPNGCLQYHTGIDGRFTTFNWGGTQHLRNQNYRVCIRQEEGI